MNKPEFLTVDHVLLIHALQIEQFGGAPGLRDAALLESAVFQPQATFDGVFIHEDIFEMAAAYHFHLVSNHVFVDGNKRVGLAAALVFLDLNGLTILGHTESLYELTMAIARGEKSKAEIANEWRVFATKKDEG